MFSIRQTFQNRMKEHKKCSNRGDIIKSEMAHHVWREKYNHEPLSNKVKIIYKTLESYMPGRIGAYARL